MTIIKALIRLPVLIVFYTGLVLAALGMGALSIIVWAFSPERDA